LDRRVNLFNSSQSLSHQCKKIKRPNVNPAIILEDMEVLPIVEEEEVGEVVVEEVTHSPVEGSQVESEQFLD